MKLHLPIPPDELILPINTKVFSEGKQIGTAFIKKKWNELDIKINKSKKWTKNDQEYNISASLEIEAGKITAVNVDFRVRF